MYAFFQLLSGAFSSDLFTELSSPGGLPVWGAGAADLDADGRVEVMGVSHGTVPFFMGATTAGLAPAGGSPWAGRAADRHGLTFCDLDRDGQPEVIVGMGGERGRGGQALEAWFRDGAGGWEDRGGRLFPMTAGMRARGLNCVDVDGDGAPELYVASHGRHHPDRLLRQVAGMWVDVGAERGLADDMDTHGGLWGDIDGDGDMDLVRLSGGTVQVVAQERGPDRALDAGRFRMAAALPWRRVQAIALEDMDSDGDLDLFLARADRSPADAAGAGAARLYLPEGDADRLSFAVPAGCERLDVEARGTLDGADAAVTTHRTTGRRVGLRARYAPRPAADRGVLAWISGGRLEVEARGQAGSVSLRVTCDAPEVAGGRLSLPLASAEIDPPPVPLESESLLLLNDGAGGFAAAPGGWGQAVAVMAADMELDGDMDLFLVRASAPGAMENPADLLLENDGAGRLSRSARFLAGDDPGGEGTGMIWADLDGDHAPEILVFNAEFDGAMAGAARLWANPGTANRWLRVEVYGADGARATGARVEVIAGGRRQARLSNPWPHYALHGTQGDVFGLGPPGSGAARVIVTWPDGARQERRVAGGQTVIFTAQPPARPARSPARPPASPA